MKILIVLTSHDQLGDTGEQTGFWLEEFAAPYYAFKDAGAEVVLASPKGGEPPLDPKSDQPDAQTEATERFNGDGEAQTLLANTYRLDQVSAEDFDAVFYPGGHGPLWDLVNNPASIALIESFVKADKPVGAVCHAPAALTEVRGKVASIWSRASASPALPMARKRRWNSPRWCRSCSRTGCANAAASTARVRTGRPMCRSTGCW